MQEVYDGIDIVKKNLDNLDLFKDLEKSLTRIKNNKELLDKIEKYNLSKDENLRMEIYSYEEIKEYKKLENEVNFLILSINQKLNKIKDTKGGCCHENN